MKGGAEVNALKKYRLEKGLTQKEVAFQVGITEMSYQRYESGQRFPDIRTAIRIGEILGIDNVNELWSGSSMVN
ncbi:MAG: helix-turn-helix transcriptional regulator [Butyrivibrio sp.]|nr:helix-turn-helix transcriptional regulator [Butyrivibrio sp.]